MSENLRRVEFDFLQCPEQEPSAVCDGCGELFNKAELTQHGWDWLCKECADERKAKDD